MPRSRSLDLDSFDPEIEKTLKRSRKQEGASTSNTMAEEHLQETKMLKNYAMSFIDGTTSSIRRLMI